MSPAPREPAGPPHRRVAGQRQRRSASDPDAPAASAPFVARTADPADAGADAPAASVARTTDRADADAGVDLVKPASRGTSTAAPRRTAAPWWRSGWVLAVLAAVTVVAVVAAVLLLVLDRRAQQVADARLAATEAARAHAETILSYDYTTLDDDFAAALAVSTGDFREEYETTSESVVRETATETEAVVEAESVTAGVVAAEADRVTVLVFVNQTTTSNRVDQPQTDLNRVRMTMVDTGTGWLVAGVDAL